MRTARGAGCWQDFITQEYRMSVKEVLDGALTGCETDNFEFALYTKSHQRVDVQLNATTRRDVSGAVVGVFGVGQDITDRKRVETEKSLVAREMQTFIDTANAPIFGIDANGLVTEWNHKAAEITMFSREEVLGKDLVEVYISLDYRVSVRQVLLNALQGQVTANFEFPIYTKDYRCVEVLLNATPRTDASGRIVGMLGVGQDITERKKVEAEKTRIATELQTFIDTTNALIFGVDVDGLVNEWNNKAEHITGYSRGHILGKDLLQVLTLHFSEVVCNCRLSTGFDWLTFLSQGFHLCGRSDSSPERDRERAQRPRNSQF
jgi:PAS domain S-box-containing protein